MIRDIDAIRDILMAIERCPDAALKSVPVLQDVPESVVLEHVRLLIEAGYIDAIDSTHYKGRNYGLLRLRWPGHDFLDGVRDPEIWKQTKAGAKQAGSWTVTFLGEMAKGYIRMKAQSLGLPLG
jgi:hypothetical protein